MTTGDRFPPRPPVSERMKWRVLFHALVLVSLLGTHVWISFERGPQDGVDARWYIEYALSIFHESAFPAGEPQVVPLYPLWLNMWMHVDPDYVDDLHCLCDNLPYWIGGKFIDDGDITTCRYLDNIGFHIQILLGCIGIGLVWIAGWLASGRLMAAHLAAMFVVYTQDFVTYGNGRFVTYGNQHIPESLAIPLFAGVNVCLAWLVLGTGRAKGRRVAVAITCGLLLGALALTRPPYESLLAALPFAAAIWMFRDRRRRREIVVTTACIMVTASLVVTPWIVRNYAQKSFVGFTQGYASSILLGRLALNDISWSHWIASFPTWSGRGGQHLASELFGSETVAHLTYGHPDYYAFDSGERVAQLRARLKADLARNVALEDRLGFLLERLRIDLPKHLAVSVPLAWRAMQQHQGLPLGSAAWLLVIFSFARGGFRNRRALAALAFCPIVILAITALVSHSIPRYGFGLLTPLSVGVASPIAWAIDGVWNRVRTWIPWTMSHDPNRSPRSHGRP